MAENLIVEVLCLVLTLIYQLFEGLIGAILPWSLKAKKDVSGDIVLVTGAGMYTEDWSGGGGVCGGCGKQLVKEEDSLKTYMYMGIDIVQTCDKGSHVMLRQL